MALSYTELLALPSAELVELLRTRDRFAHRWLNSLAHRTVESRRRVGDLQLGVRRQSLNAVLRRFHRRGVTSLTYRQITVMDAADLRERLVRRRLTVTEQF